MAEKVTELPNQESYNERVDKLLKERGISEIETGKPQVFEIKIASLVDQSNEEKANRVRRETLAVMEELEISPDTKVTIEKREVKFNEDVTQSAMSEIFPDRPVQQLLTHYLLRSNSLVVGDEVWINTFSHGGTIRPDTSEKSPFLPLIHTLAEKRQIPIFTNTINHRGSRPQDKEKYSLWDRTTDLLVAHTVMTSGDLLEDIDPNSNKLKFALVGNSMGGDVVALASKDLQPNVIILPQPAAYSEKAHFVPLGPAFTGIIREPSSWKTSPAFDSLEEYLARGGKALIIGAREDEAIPGGVAKRYMKEVTYAYANRAVSTEGKTHFTGLMWINVGHTSTTPDEIRAIVESFSV